MRLLPFHNEMSIVLALSLLANNAGVHCYGHAHEGGDAFHSHTDGALADGDCDCCAHTCDCDHSEGLSHDDANYLVAGSVSHAHVTFFGFDISIPDSDNSHDDHGEPTTLAHVHLFNDCGVVLVLRSLDLNVLQTLFLTVNVRDVVAFTPATIAVPQVPFAPLCDGARFERCGVFLI